MCIASQLVVQSYTGEIKTYPYQGKTKNQEMLVQQLKEEILKLFALKELTPDMVRLILGGKPLDNDSAPLSDYDIKEMSHIQMVRKVHGG